MRQAAKAAHLSLGGLYHYFLTKRDLVLHSLKPEALARVCTDFHDRHAQWERTDHSRFVEANIAYMARQCVHSSGRRFKPRSTSTPRSHGTTFAPASNAGSMRALDR